MQPVIRIRAPLGPILRIGFIAALGALLFLSPVQAQETPDAATDIPSETPVPQTDTRVFLEIEAPSGQPVNDGDTFFVHIMIADVESLSAFDFQLSYDRERIEPIRLDDDGGTPAAEGELRVEGGDVLVAGEIGEFFADSPRDSLCTGPLIRPALQNRVLGLCAGVALPVCLGGPAGVDGSGRLATIEFKSKGGEMTEVALVQTTLVADDVEPECDPQSEDFRPVVIEHSQGPTVTVLLSGGGGSGILLIAIIVIVVVLVLAAGLGGFLLYQRRSAGSSSAAS
ncbi:MAG: hypothetical protein IH865_13845 [Chloroflexi bacterium]|nr:hypothetical protein [Chloroflexota bacterium]